jgi:hypothetical protein
MNGKPAWKIGGRETFLVAVIQLSVAYAAYYAIPHGLTDLGIDYRVFWRAAAAPVSELYRVGHMPFAYPPTGLLLFKPLALLSQPWGLMVWTAVSVALFVVAVAAVAGRGIALLSLLSNAALKGLILGQSAMLLGGAMLLAVAMPPLAAGMLFGAVLVIKPQVALLAPLAYLVRRDWRVLQGMAAAASAMLLASLLLVGWPGWAAWLDALPQFRAILIQDGVLDRVITSAGRAEHVGLPPWPFVLAGLAIGSAATIKLAARAEGPALVALIVAASLVAAPYAHVHDTVALMPFCLLVIRRGPWWAVALAAIIFVGPPGLTMLSLMLGLAGAVLWAMLEDRRHGPQTPLALDKAPD